MERKKDVVKAAKLWKKGAEMGNAWAVLKYAECLAERKGVEPGIEKDSAKAKEYIEKGRGKCKSGNCN